MNEIQQLMLELEAAANAAGGALTEEQALKYQKQINEQIGLTQKRLSARDVWHADAWFRPNELELLREYLSRSFYARCRAVRPVYNHLLISAAPEDLPSARIFAARIAAAEAEFFGEEQESCVRTLTEEQLLSCSDPELREALLHELGQARILLVPEFEALDLPRFETALDGLGIGRYAVILCAMEETAEEIRGYAANDYRMARYYLRHSYHYTDKTAGDAYEYACRQLEEGGLTLTEEFREKLQIYVEAVYPEAVLHGAEFVRDLLIRIEDTRASSLRFSPTLTAADVPYSRKAELLAEAAPEPKMPETSASELPEASDGAEMKQLSGSGGAMPEAPEAPIELTNEAFAALAYELDGSFSMTERERSREGRPINLLLLAMSTFPGPSADKSLICSDFIDQDHAAEGRKYTGRGQLDPVPKKVARDLQELGQALDYVVLLCTAQTELPVAELSVQEGKQKYLIRNVSPVEFFKAQIERYLNPDTPHYDTIRVESGNPARAVEETIQKIRGLAETSTAPDGQIKLRLFIDNHGGLRTTQMITQSVISLLETDATRIKTQLYTVVNDTKPDKYIAQSDEAMRITGFVSGIMEVINYSRTASLHQYFGAEPEMRVQDIMNALDEIADGITWCNLQGFEAGLDHLRARISAQQNMSSTEEIALDSRRGVNETYLKLFLENIRNAYGAVLKQDRTPVDEVRWCLEKGFYQQALALIEAKIPDLLHRRGVFSHDPSAKSNKNKSIGWDQQFNACVFYVGTNGTNNRNNSTIKQYFRANSDRFLSDEDYACRLRLIQEMQNSSILRTGLETNSKPEELKDGTSIQVRFDPIIPDDALVSFLLLHHVFKDLRNGSMHVRPFEYDISRLNKAFSYYLDLCETIIAAKQSGSFPQEAELGVGSVGLAVVRRVLARQYYLRLSDGTNGVLQRRSNQREAISVDARLRIRINGVTSAYKTCELDSEVHP